VSFLRGATTLVRVKLSLNFIFGLLWIVRVAGSESQTAIVTNASQREAWSDDPKIALWHGNSPIVSLSFSLLASVFWRSMQPGSNPRISHTGTCNLRAAKAAFQFRQHGPEVIAQNAVGATHDLLSDLVLDQPCQRLLAGFESCKFAPRESYKVLLEDWGEVLRSDPCRFLDVGLVEDRAFFHCPQRSMVKQRSGEIREQ
jgi:hypothetical protein